MNAPEDMPVHTPVLSQEKTLRRLFLMLFLRGRSSRGLNKDKAPKSVGSKLGLSLFFYGLFGVFISLTFLGKPVFPLSIYLHAMTLVFLGMFVAGSAGGVLFNPEEADILMHRPVTARALLRAKISVLVMVSLWLAGAFNLGGFFVGTGASNGGWLFPMAHALSTTMEALFCTGCVVMIYQLCLRWFGRERLEGLMTTAQVLVAISAVVGGQLVPHLMRQLDDTAIKPMGSWWIWILPPAWFAGFDDAIAGSRVPASWILAAIGAVATTVVLGLAFGKLAHDYETGLQTLNESSPRRLPKPGRRRWIDVAIQLPPLKWWLRDSVTRASFLLTAAYLVRDRDMKLRLYPGLAPMFVMPIIFMAREFGRTEPGTGGGFGIAFASGYLGLIPMFALEMLQQSPQWQAADLFRLAPLQGPTRLSNGVRRAVLCFMTLPVLGLLALIAWLMPGDHSRLLLLLPGVIALPVYAMIPCLGRGAVPLSMSIDAAQSATRVTKMLCVMVISGALAGVAIWSWSGGWFRWMVLVEAILAVAAYAAMRAHLGSLRWMPLE